MEPQTATLIAAVIAASAAVLNVFLVAAGKREEEIRAATRQAIAEHLNEIGRLIYEVVALADVQARSTTDNTHKVRHANARAAAVRLKNKRLEVRYSLWGIDMGIRELTRLPDWVAHAKVDAQARSEILAAGSALGDALDVAIRSAYLTGTLPGLMARWKVARAQKKLRAVYDRFSGSRLTRADATPTQQGARDT